MIDSISNAAQDRAQDTLYMESTIMRAPVSGPSRRAASQLSARSLEKRPDAIHRAIQCGAQRRRRGVEQVQVEVDLHARAQAPGSGSDSFHQHHRQPVATMVVERRRDVW